MAGPQPVAGHRPAVDLPASGPQAVVRAATRAYLCGEPLDMSALAASLGIGRATLYRWVGNRDNLLATVLADATERTWRATVARRPGAGPAHVVDVVGGFVAAVLAVGPLRVLARREPMVFIRLSAGPGAVGDRVTALVQELLEQQVDAGTLAPALPVGQLGAAIVRVGTAHAHVALLGEAEPDLAGLLDVVWLLLGPPEPDAGPHHDRRADGPAVGGVAPPRTELPPLLPAPRVPPARTGARTERLG